MKKYVNYSGLQYLIEELKNKFVQQQSGKGLSTNDFTTILKDKLTGIESGAEVNTVTSVNSKLGDIVLTSDDIDFLSSATGATATTIRAAIDDIINDTSDHEGRLNGLDSSKANVSYVDGKLDDKVDKVVGKGLSTNDYTDAAKTKVEGVEAGSQVNVIELIKKNGTNLTITNKAVDIDVPTKYSDLTNDLTYRTEAEIKTLIQDVGKLKKKIVTSLPPVAEADENTMYLIRNAQDTGYEEWLLINGTFEIMGDTAAVDFTGYVHEDDLVPITNAEIDAFLNA